MAEGDKPDKKPDKGPAAKEAAPGAVKSKKAVKGKKKEEAKRVGYTPNIEEGLEVKPARLKVRYRQEAVPAMMKEFALKNPNQVPRLRKIVVNMGIGEAIANNKLL